jgi:peptide/nickel transport system permease protein
MAPQRRPYGQWLRIAPVALIVAVVVLGPFIIPHDPTRVITRPGIGPGGKFWFGTDTAGMDVFSRTIDATRTNVLLAGFVAILASALGIGLGLAIGMNESRRGPVGMVARGASRLIDLMQAVPAVILAMVAVSFYGVDRTTITLILAFILAPNQARLVRSEVLRVRSEAYLDAARMAGLGEAHLTVRHVLPNSSWPALENVPIVFAVAVTLTAALGFIGVGLPPPTPEWGSMISRGVSDALVGRWWPSTFPALALAFTVASVGGGVEILRQLSGANRPRRLLRRTA